MLNKIDVVEWFTKSPAGRAIVAEHEAEHLAELQVHADAIVAVREALAKKLAKLQAACEKAKAGVDEANARLIEATIALRQAEAARMNAQSHAHAIERRAEQVLRQSANPKIDDFHSELMRAYRQDMRIEVSRKEEWNRNWDTGGRVWVETASSKPYLDQHLKSMLAAIEEVRTWYLNVWSDAQVEEQITALRDRLQASRDRARGELAPAAA